MVEELRTRHHEQHIQHDVPLLHDVQPHRDDQGHHGDLLLGEELQPDHGEEQHDELHLQHE